MNESESEAVFAGDRQMNVEPTPSAATKTEETLEQWSQLGLNPIERMLTYILLEINNRVGALEENHVKRDPEPEAKPEPTLTRVADMEVGTRYVLRKAKWACNDSCFIGKLFVVIRKNETSRKVIDMHSDNAMNYEIWSDDLGEIIALPEEKPKNYMCRCSVCNKAFYGGKRSIVCDKCQNKTSEPPVRERACFVCGKLAIFQSYVDGEWYCRECFETDKEPIAVSPAPWIEAAVREIAGECFGLRISGLVEPLFSEIIAKYSPKDEKLYEILRDQLETAHGVIRELEQCVCPNCNGKKRIQCNNPDHNFIMAIGTVGNRSASESQCPACGYSGEMKCDTCGGSGSVLTKDAIAFLIEKKTELEAANLANLEDTLRETETHAEALRSRAELAEAERDDLKQKLAVERWPCGLRQWQ